MLENLEVKKYESKIACLEHFFRGLNILQILTLIIRWSRPLILNNMLLQGKIGKVVIIVDQTDSEND